MRSSKKYFEDQGFTGKTDRREKSYYWNAIIEYCKYFIYKESSVLEVGCGTGDLLHRIGGGRKVGIDFSKEMIRQAREKYSEVEFHEMSCELLELEEKFDVIILSNLIGYLDDIEQGLHELNKVCHSNTKIIITYYNYLWEPILKFAEWVGVKQKTPPQNWLSQVDINNLLQLAGFDVYRTTRQMLIPINIPGLSWIFNKYLAKIPLLNYFCINTFTFASPRSSLDATEVEDRYSVSIVIPARNESGNIEDAILRVPKFGKSVEIIFIEGNSTDDTWDKIQEIATKYTDTHNIKIDRQDGKGKGDAVRKGYQMATGDILMILDADLTVRPEDLPKFYNAIASGKGEFINGSRLVYTMEKQAMRYLNILGNKFFSALFTWLLDQPFKDTLCGTKVLFRKDYDRIKVNRTFFGEFDPFGDFDLIFGAHKLNLKIVELPIRYQERTYGETNISRFKHGFILLKMCFFAARKIKFR